MEACRFVSLAGLVVLLSLGCPAPDDMGDDDSSVVADDDDASGDDDSTGDDDTTADDDIGGDDDSAAGDDDSAAVDADGDGWTAGQDCDDQDATVHPDAPESCANGQDDDCDGLIDCEDADCSAAVACIPASFVLVPAGTFTMGSPSNEVGRDDDEQQHEVTLTRDVYVGSTEVTQGDFMAITGWNPSDCSVGCGTEYPVQNVTWFDAVAYANLMSAAAGLTECYSLADVACRNGPPVGSDYVQCIDAGRDGIESAEVSVNGFSMTVYQCEGYRLPTEAEWEYAARAGETAAFYTGGNLQEGDDNDCTGHLTLDDGSVLDDFAWYCGAEPTTGHEVAELQANDWGLYDVSGNMWEWVWDLYGSEYGGAVTNPTGPALGSGRGARGGAWDLYPSYCRSAARYSNPPGDRYGCRGFRLARTSP